MNVDKLQEEILKSINILVDKKFKNLKFNYYIEGKVLSKNLNGTYLVIINGEQENLKARSELNLNINDVVLILVPNGNTSFKFIDLKRPY